MVFSGELQNWPTNLFMSLAFIMMSSLCVCVYITLCIGVLQLYEGPFEVNIVPKMLICEAIFVCVNVCIRFLWCLITKLRIMCHKNINRSISQYNPIHVHGIIVSGCAVIMLTVCAALDIETEYSHLMRLVSLLASFAR